MRTRLGALLGVLGASLAYGQQEQQALPWLEPVRFEVEETIEQDGRVLVLRHRVILQQTPGGWNLNFLELTPVSLDGTTLADLLARGEPGGEALGHAMTNVPTIYPDLQLTRSGAIEGTQDWSWAVREYAVPLARGFQPEEGRSSEQTMTDFLNQEKLIETLSEGAEAPLLQALGERKARALWQAWASLWLYASPTRPERKAYVPDAWSGKSIRSRAILTRGEPEEGRLTLGATLKLEGDEASAAYTEVVHEVLRRAGRDPAQCPPVRCSWRQKVEAEVDATTLCPQRVKLEIAFESTIGDAPEVVREETRTYRFDWEHAERQRDGD